MRIKIRAAAAGFCLVCASSVVSAAGFSPAQLVVFGDSLSDNGNAYLGLGTAATGNYAQATYNGKTVQYFTDGLNTTPATSGPVGLWTDQLAGKLGIADPAPFLTGGTDFAVGGADTGSNGRYFVGDQVNAYLGTTKNTASPSALYTFWAGANDIADGKSPITAADNISSYIAGLGARGAKNFVWVNLPPLGDTPAALAADKVDPLASAGLNALSLAFDTEWQLDLTTLRTLGLNVIGVDAYSLFQSIEADNGAKCTVGVSDPICFSNITTPAQGQTGVNPNDYLFWDIAHPTTAADTLIADLAITGGLTPVPEPGTGVLASGAMLLAAAGMLIKRR